MCLDIVEMSHHEEPAAAGISHRQLGFGANFQPRFLTLRNVGIYKPQEPDELWEDALTETQNFLVSLVTKPEAAQ